MLTVTTAPHKFTLSQQPSVFLAGSIDMGTAQEWQLYTINKLENFDIEIFNPRRTDWNSDWVQDIANEKFSEQVNWELDALAHSDCILFYFDKNGKAPITLMELGYVASLKKDIIVCCPKGYWRRGNVQIICHRHNIKITETLDEAIGLLIKSPIISGAENVRKL